MRQRMVMVVIALVVFVPHVACSQPKTIQEPVVAGAFYPGEKAALAAEVKKLLSETPKKSLAGRLIGLIAPHAGYRYSGQIAATAFKQLEGRRIRRVVIMAPSHRVAIAGAALSTKDAYRTPLGLIPIDTASVRALIKTYGWALDDGRPYAVEHSLEVLLPFLQMTLTNFTIVPMIVGTRDRAVLEKIAQDLNAMFADDKTLFVVSSDLSHYHPYNDAVAIDRKTLDLVCEKDPKAFYAGVAHGEAELCGSSPVFILKTIAKARGAKLELLQYANSGDTSGDRSKVVGYAAIAVIAPNAHELGAKQKNELLRLARATVKARVHGQKLPALPTDPVLAQDGAAFVTLKKQGELRGCIGQIIARGPLNTTVQEMAVAAATQDPRFPPVKPNELKDIHVEVSVLTAPEELADPLAVRVGTDGLILESSRHRGVLLPQVPTEQGWNKQQYLDGICRKSGMGANCWKEKGVKLLRFQAIVFGE